MSIPTKGRTSRGRLVVRPFADAAGASLAGAGAAIAGSRGDQPLTLPGFRSAGQQTFFAYAGG